MPKVMTEEDKHNRVKKMAVSTSVEVYDGVRALAALNGKTMNDYVFNVLKREVKNNLPAIKKVFEAQKLYQEMLFVQNVPNDETKKAVDTDDK